MIEPLLLVTSLAALQQAAPVVEARAPFAEIGARALPGVVTRCGSPDKDWIVEVNGGGVLLGDFDGDAKCDLVVVDGSTLERVEKGESGFPPRLFLGNGDATFRPASDAWKIAGGRWGMGGATGDVDGDGTLDLVITEWGATRLLLNQGNKGFVDATAKSGLAQGGWSTSAAFLDYDRDGLLDLVVVEYLAFDPHVIAKRGAGSCRWKGHDVMCGPEGLTPTHDHLYRGRGDGTFVDVTDAAKMRPERPAFGLGAMTLDYDADGDTDVYVSNDSMPNHLWENQGDGTFRDVAYRRGVSHDANGKEQASMGIACGDWNGDGRDELFVTNFSGESNALYVSTKSGGYRERSSPTGLAGVSLPWLGWGTSFADFDHDADLDLYVLNGHVYPQADLSGTDTRYAQADFFHRSLGDGRFSSEPLSGAPPAVSRASAAADLDGDGDLDVVGLVLDGPVRVFENLTRAGSGTHWLRVRLRSRSKNREALGARIVAEWEGGRQTAEIRTAGGYQAAVPAEAHFGLGTVARLTRLRVLWPSGTEQVLEDVALDRVLVVEEEAPR